MFFYESEVYANADRYIQQQTLVSEILNRLQNQTASDISIFEDGNMYTTWSETITAEAPDGRVFEIDEQTQITTQHNFTAQNGYVYRDNGIYKSDGSQIFS